MRKKGKEKGRKNGRKQGRKASRACVGGKGVAIDQTEVALP